MGVGVGVVAVALDLGQAVPVVVVELRSLVDRAVAVVVSVVADLGRAWVVFGAIEEGVVVAVAAADGDPVAVVVPVGVRRVLTEVGAQLDLDAPVDVVGAEQAQRDLPARRVGRVVGHRHFERRARLHQPGELVEAQGQLDVEALFVAVPGHARDFDGGVGHVLDDEVAVLLAVFGDRPEVHERGVGPKASGDPAPAQSDLEAFGGGAGGHVEDQAVLEEALGLRREHDVELVGLLPVELAGPRFGQPEVGAACSAEGHLRDLRGAAGDVLHDDRALEFGPDRQSAEVELVGERHQIVGREGQSDLVSAAPREDGERHQRGCDRRTAH